MKTYLCIVGISSVFVAIVQCEMAPEFRSRLDECLKEFELSEETLKSPNFDDTKVKCAAACVYKKFDRLADGKISADKEIEFAKKYVPDRIDDTFKDKVTECVNKANEEKDDCAVGGVMFKCMFDKIKITLS